MTNKHSKIVLASSLLIFTSACSTRSSQSVTNNEALYLNNNIATPTSSLKTLAIRPAIAPIPRNRDQYFYPGSSHLGSGLIFENDVLLIDVYKNPDLKTTVRVDNSGHINLPLLKKVHVKGLSASQLEQKLQKGLEKDFLVNAHVSVLIKESNSEKFTIEGAVKKSGVYSSSGKTTLLQAIALAGGLSEDADVHHATLLRKGSHGDVVQQAVDIAAIRRGQLEDISLLRGDRIIIQKAVYNRVTVTGAVAAPGIFPLSEGITILQAITLSGGFSPLAHKDHVVLVRPDSHNGTFNKYRINMEEIMSGNSIDPKVQADDRIIVIESTQKVLLEEVTKVLSPLTSLRVLTK